MDNSFDWMLAPQLAASPEVKLWTHTVVRMLREGPSNYDNVVMRICRAPTVEHLGALHASFCEEGWYFAIGQGLTHAVQSRRFELTMQGS